MGRDSSTGGIPSRKDAPDRRNSDRTDRAQARARLSHPTEPPQGSRFTGSGVVQRPREALAALGILGLHTASPVGLSDSSPPTIPGPASHPLRISVKSASHQRFTTRSRNQERLTPRRKTLSPPLRSLRSSSLNNHPSTAPFPFPCFPCFPSVPQAHLDRVCGSRTSPRRFDGAASPGLDAGPWRRTSSGCAVPGSTT
jgi:hypothetical protein